MLKDQLNAILEAARTAVENAATPSDIEEIRLRFLGKKGELTAMLRGMGALSAEEKPVFGQHVNNARTEITDKINEKIAYFEKNALNDRLSSETIDVSLPGHNIPMGHEHILSKVLAEVRSIFLGMGFENVEGPEVELDYYNFQALNMPKEHPARDTQDTFYFSDSLLLRTQTSSVQIRHMENHKPPIRMICPGAVYRSDEVDATHSPIFHQIEGLVVDKGITMANLKGTLETFAKNFYSPDTVVRFRPHHFPYTEPSAEMDVQCFACKGKGCRLCKGEGWIEILGAGMVHPQVLRGVGIDPDIYSGFAFGMGHERIAMLRYKIDDLRLLYENDVRFLSQF